VFSVGQITAGTAHNIIPDKAKICGTYRMYSEKMRELVTQRLYEIAEHTASAMRCEVDIEVEHQGLPVVNDENVTQRLREAWVKLGKEDDFYYEMTTASEDVAR